MAGAATAVEKKAFVLFALFSALRERRCTPREVSIVDDVDDPLPAPPTTAALARSKDIPATWAPAEEQSSQRTPLGVRARLYPEAG